MNYNKKKHRLVYVISVLVIIAVALVFFWQYDQNLNDTFSQIDGENLEAQTQSLHNDVTARIKDVESSVKAISKTISPKMDYYTRDELNKLLTDISTDIESFNVSYTSLDELDPANFTDNQAYVISCIKNGDTAISDALYQANYNQSKPFFGIYAPVSRNGNVVGFVRALLNIDVLSSSNQEGFLRDSVVSKVVYGDGSFLSNLKTKDDLNLFTVLGEASDDKKDLETLRKAFSQDETTVVKMSTIDGDVYVACAPLPYNDWHIFSTCTASALGGYKDDVSALTLLTLLAVLIVTLAIGLIALFFLRKQSQKVYAELDRFSLLINFSDTLLCEYSYADDLLSLTPNAVGLLGIEETQIVRFSQVVATGDIVHKDDLPVLSEFLDNPPHTEKFQEFELRIKATENNYLWMMVEAGAIFDRNGKPVKIIAKLTNNSRARDRLESLKEMAENDMLTSMLRHYKFKEMVINLLKDGTDETTTKALCMIDGDKFKTINDHYGHSVGDTCLVMVSETMKRVASGYALISRYGGDEFLLFINSFDSLESKIESLLDAISSISIPGYPEIHLSASLGGVIYDGQMSYDELFMAADHNLYSSKNKGPGSYTIT